MSCAHRGGFSFKLAQELIGERANRLSNRKRLSELLDLLTVGLNGHANERAFAKVIRLHFEGHAGRSLLRQRPTATTPGRRCTRERWSAVQRAASSGHQQPRQRTKQCDGCNRQRPCRKDAGNHQPDDEHTRALRDPLVPTVPDDGQGRVPAFLTPDGNNAPQQATTTTAPAPRWRCIAALSTRPSDRHQGPRGGSSCGSGSIAGVCRARHA